MKYMGSKNRHARELLPFILEGRTAGQWYVEPFVGGGNIIDKVAGNRIGSDIHECLIEALVLIRDNADKLPDLVTEEGYAAAKEEPNKGIRGYIGFAMSFGGKWFGGYRRDKAGTKGCIDNMRTQSRRSKQNALKQQPGLQGVQLVCTTYDHLWIPKGSIIYCDPPYANTTKYKDSFDHAAFWQWCRDKTKEGHKVFVSEYTAPEDFTCVWQKTVNNTLVKDSGSKKGTEKLFCLTPNAL